jgi:superfamily II DNA or RNA helicase
MILGGIVNACGGCTTQESGFEITQPIEQEQLANDIVYLGRSLGFACYKRRVKLGWFCKGYEWRVYFSSDSLNSIPPVYTTGIRVRPVGRDEYYGFTLNGNCRYLMGDFTVTHNTCTGISIAEGFKEYVLNLDRKIVVLAKNKNIQRNFANELLSQCTGNEYVTDAERRFYFSQPGSKLTVHAAQNNTKRNELINKVHRRLNKTYRFLTYGSFVNRVLGAKIFETDDYGMKTSKVKRSNGEPQRQLAKDAIINFNNTVIIVDEAHNVTNNDVYKALHQVLSRSYNYRLILLTATPMYDNPKEIFEISNLLNITSTQLPIRKELLKPDWHNNILASKVSSKWINGNVLKGGIINVTDAGMTVLKAAFKGKVSYIQANTETNPQKIIKGHELIPRRTGTSNVVYCQMSKDQYITYMEALKQDVRHDSTTDISDVAIENANETASDSKTSSLFKNSSDASTMTYPKHLFGKDGFMSIFEKKQNGGYNLLDKNVLTDHLEQYSSKLFKLLKNVNKSPGNVFIYSNYVSFGGTTLIKYLLLANGYKLYRDRDAGDKNSSRFVVLDDSTNVETREKYRRLFNAPENKDGSIIKIVIGSPVISEGITLKNVRQVHILEPSWNMSRVNQIIGRAVRNYSHQDLDPENRTVSVYKYVSVYYPKNTPPPEDTIARFFIDREKYILSEEKDRANKQVERALKEISFDCELMRPRNIKPSNIAGTADCDYQSCDFSCDIVRSDDAIDKTTYNINLQTFEAFDIKLVTTILRDLFKKHFVWSLDDILASIRNIDNTVSKEVVFHTLGQITTSKSVFVDRYNRDGFIICKGDYYIFNGADIDINTSLYTKMLDFSEDKTKYNLREYVKKSMDTDLYQAEPKTVKVEKEVIELSPEEINYNINIIENNKIFGTFRSRNQGNNKFGPNDGKFRIVDMRKTVKAKKSTKKSSDDKRQQITGMVVKSYERPQLMEIVKSLGIKVQGDLKKDQLGNLIKKHLENANLVLK